MKTRSATPERRPDAAEGGKTPIETLMAGATKTFDDPDATPKEKADARALLGVIHVHDSTAKDAKESAKETRNAILKLTGVDIAAQEEDAKPAAAPAATVRIGLELLLRFRWNWLSRCVCLFAHFLSRQQETGIGKGGFTFIPDVSPHCFDCHLTLELESDSLSTFPF